MSDPLRTYFRQWKQDTAKKEKRRKRVREAVRRWRARKLREDPDFFRRINARNREKRQAARRQKQERMAELREMAPLAIERGELPPGYHYWSGAPLTKEMLADIWELHYRRGGKPFDEMQ